MTLKRLASMQKIYYGTNHQLEHLLKIPTNDSKTSILNWNLEFSNLNEHTQIFDLSYVSTPAATNGSQLEDSGSRQWWSDDADQTIRRGWSDDQTMPIRWSDDADQVIRRCRSGDQTMPIRWSDDADQVIRRCRSWLTTMPIRGTDDWKRSTEQHLNTI